MNRERKFHAWNTKYNQMTIEPFTFNGFDGDCFYDYCSRPNGSPLWYLEDMIIREYTGLKDKNGKEIYEGNIVKYYNSKQVVIYCEGCYIPLVRVEHGYNCIDNYNPDDFEIIGNIYENKELLNETST